MEAASIEIINFKIIYTFIAMRIIKVLFIIILFACNKEESTPTKIYHGVIGQWYIVPVGNPQDSFRYLFFASNKCFGCDTAHGGRFILPSPPLLDKQGDTTIQNAIVSGHVTDGRFSIAIRDTDIFSVYFRNTSNVIKHHSYYGENTTGDITDSLPSTIY